MNELEEKFYRHILFTYQEGIKVKNRTGIKVKIEQSI